MPKRQGAQPVAKPVLVVDVAGAIAMDPALAALARGAGYPEAVARLAQLVDDAEAVLGQRTVLVLEGADQLGEECSGERVDGLDSFMTAFAVPPPQFSREATLIGAAVAYAQAGNAAVVVTDDGSVAAELSPLRVPTMHPADYIQRLRSAQGRLEAMRLTAARELGQPDDLVAQLEAASKEPPHQERHEPPQPPEDGKEDSQ